MSACVCFLEHGCVHGWLRLVLQVFAFTLFGLALLILAFPVRRSFRDDWRRRRGDR